MNGRKNFLAKIWIEKKSLLTINNRVCHQKWVHSTHWSRVFVENNPLQFRPSIPRRPSPGRLAAAHNLLFTSQIHNYQEQKPSTIVVASNGEHDEGINSVSTLNYLVEKHSNEVNEGISRFFFLQTWLRIVFYFSSIFRPHRIELVDQFTVVQREKKPNVSLVMELILKVNLQHEL